MTRVARLPERFPHAERFHNECGPYQIRAILNALDKDAPVEALYRTPKHALRDWTLPWHVPGILKRHGVEAHTRFWFRRALRARLRAALAENRAIMLVIKSIHGKGGYHWISAWGYDDATDEFLCYDSQAPASEHTCGNTRYAAHTLERALPGFGTFAVTTKLD